MTSMSEPHVTEEQKQAFVEGLPGAGKSHILLRAEQDLKERGHSMKNFLGQYTWAHYKYLIT